MQNLVINKEWIGFQTVLTIFETVLCTQNFVLIHFQSIICSYLIFYSKVNIFRHYKKIFIFIIGRTFGYNIFIPGNRTFEIDWRNQILLILNHFRNTSYNTPSGGTKQLKDLFPQNQYDFLICTYSKSAILNRLA